MVTEAAEISAAAVDAVNYRVAQLGEPLEAAVRDVEASLRGRGIPVTLHLSTTSPVTSFRHSDDVAVYEVQA